AARNKASIAARAERARIMAPASWARRSASSVARSRIGSIDGMRASQSSLVPVPRAGPGTPGWNSAGGAIRHARCSSGARRRPHTMSLYDGVMDYFGNALNWESEGSGSAGAATTHGAPATGSDAHARFSDADAAAAVHGKSPQEMQTIHQTYHRMFG